MFCVISGGCAPRMLRGNHSDDERSKVALYRARIVSSIDESARKFRMWLFVAPDGRLHAELISGIGTTEAIIDSSPTQMSVHFLRAGVSYSGPVEADTLRDLWGIDSSLAEFVGLFMTGVAPPGWELEAGVEEYPSELRYQREGRLISLTLKRVQQLGVDPESLGSGMAPIGIEQRPLSELRLEQLPGVDREEP
jgi:hypothetical protein